MRIALALVASYMLGSVPFGFIIGKLLKGIDIREYGSGNIGATNILRTIGFGPFVLVLILDAGKGLAAVDLANGLHLGHWLVVAAGMMAILGHTFSAFLRFRGGKAVATSLGAIIGLDPVIAAIAFGVWLALVGVTRYVSVASLIATISVPLLMTLWKAREVPAPYLILASVAALAIVLKHIPNMKRLAKGTEARVGQKVDINGDGGAKGE